MALRPSHCAQPKVFFQLGAVLFLSTHEDPTVPAVLLVSAGPWSTPCCFIFVILLCYHCFPLVARTPTSDYMANAYFTAMVPPIRSSYYS
jgi:hypothetical protein